MRVEKVRQPRIVLHFLSPVRGMVRIDVAGSGLIMGLKELLKPVDKTF